MNHFTFIVNPEAGRGAGRKLLSRLRSLLDASRFAHELLITRGPGEAVDMARRAETNVVVAVGGDGTVNEVANGVVGTGKTLGIIPAGSGNDFIKSIGVPPKLEGAFDQLCKAHPRSIDVGTVHCSGVANGTPPRVFVNGVGIGFDAAVAAKTLEIRRLRGTALYLAAVLRTLGKYRSPHFEIDADGKHVSSKQLLIAIGNGRCAGGGFYLTPDAIVDDGKLDVCLIDDLPILKILRLMPRVMHSNHHNAEGVNFLRTQDLHVRGDSPFFVHADGEIVGRGVTGVEIGLDARKLSVLVGSDVPAAA